jgi:hypothetical protein
MRYIFVLSIIFQLTLAVGQETSAIDTTLMNIDSTFLSTSDSLSSDSLNIDSTFLSTSDSLSSDSLNIDSTSLRKKSPGSVGKIMRMIKEDIVRIAKKNLEKPENRKYIYAAGAVITVPILYIIFNRNGGDNNSKKVGDPPPWPS